MNKLLSSSSNFYEQTSNKNYTKRFTVHKTAKTLLQEVLENSWDTSCDVIRAKQGFGIQTDDNSWCIEHLTAGYESCLVVFLQEWKYY